MSPEEKLIRKIHYQAQHRGTKEMDYVISGAVKIFLRKTRSRQELETLNQFLCRDDADLVHDMTSAQSQDKNPYHDILKCIENFKRHRVYGQ